MDLPSDNVLPMPKPSLTVVPRAAPPAVLPPPEPGFEHVSRYWDPKRQSVAAKVMPGEFYVTRQDEFILTVLGSCVAACIWDPVARVGGMNHFMLASPGAGSEESPGIGAATRYGVFAMEFLVNGVLALGARRERLCVKVAGGGAVLGHMTSSVGAKNVEFVRQYIATERLKLMGEHLGGELPRKLCFHPLSGSAQVKALATIRNDTIVTRERRYAEKLASGAPSGAVELFEGRDDTPRPPDRR